MAEQKAGVHDVEALIERAREDVCVAVLDVCQARGRRLVACQLELRVVDIDADDAAARPDAPRQLKRDVAATAAHVETAHAQIDAQAVEQVAGRRAEGARDEPQPFPAVDSTPQHVAARHADLLRTRLADRLWALPRGSHSARAFVRPGKRSLVAVPVPAPPGAVVGPSLVTLH